MINEEIDRPSFGDFRSVDAPGRIVVASVSCIYNLGVEGIRFQHQSEIGRITRGDLTKQLVKIGFERTNGALKRALSAFAEYFEIMPAAEEIFTHRFGGSEISSSAVADATRKTKKN